MEMGSAAAGPLYVIRGVWDPSTQPCRWISTDCKLEFQIFPSFFALFEQNKSLLDVFLFWEHLSLWLSSSNSWRNSSSRLPYPTSEPAHIRTRFLCHSLPPLPISCSLSLSLSPFLSLSWPSSALSLYHSLGKHSGFSCNFLLFINCRTSSLVHLAIYFSCSHLVHSLLIYSVFSNFVLVVFLYTKDPDS